MIPITRGPVPLDDSGNAIEFTNYRKFRKALINVLGPFCSYCNAPLAHSPQIEHVNPVNPPPGYVPGDPVEWNNILLACGPCNNAKSNTPYQKNLYYFPTDTNPLMAFTTSCETSHPHHVILVERENLTEAQKRRSAETIKLLKLGASDNRDAVVDLRSHLRTDRKRAIEHTRELYLLVKTGPGYNSEIHPKIAANATILGSGFFALALDVFADCPEVLNELINLIPGLNKAAFDPAGNPKGLNPNNATDPI